MGGKGGGGGNEAVEEQKKQAAEARKKEEERKARIQQGMGAIKGAFEGSPVMGTRNAEYDWSQFRPAGLATAGAAATPAQNIPAGFTAVQVANPNYKAPRGGGADGRPVSQRVPANLSRDGLLPWAGNPDMKGDPFVTITRPGANAAAAGSNKVWALRDAQGNIHYQGDKFNADQQYATGETTGGFDDGYYNDYKQGILDYYQPQVADQFSDAKKELTYRLARAGTLRSSAAASETADLGKQYDLNSANILNKADQGASDLRSNVASERAKIEGQLYASEDPTAASNQALAAVKNISLDQPSLSPLGMLFNLATVGGANALKGYKNAQLSNQFGGGSPTGSGRFIS
jgi:hypothetical protein